MKSVQPRILSVYIAATVILIVLGCTVKLTAFLVPQVLAPGGIFEVVVAGTHSGNNASEGAAAVLQVPAGFTVISALTLDRRPITRNDPAVMALYKAETGHSLAVFSGTNSSTNAGSNHVLRVRLRAPVGGGPYVFKVSLAAQTGATWAINDPPGISDFAQINANPYARTVVMAKDPWTGAPVYQNYSWGLPVANPPGANDSGWSGVALEDFNNDGRDDLACIGRKGNGPRAFLSPLPGTPWHESSIGLSYSFSGRSDVAFGDFDHDGRIDLADANGLAWLGDGGKSWTLATGIEIRGGGMEGVAVADVNNDGYDDVAFSGHFSDYIQVFLSNGRGGFTESSNGLPNGAKPSNTGGHKLMMKDLNGDSFADILWCQYYSTDLWLGDGKGNWKRAPAHGLNPYQHWGVDAADLDGDGDPDLVFGVFHSGPTPPTIGGVEVYENLGTAKFKLRTSTGIPTTADSFQDVALADFDRDGRVDILAGRRFTSGPTTPSFSSLEIWMNRGGFTFKQQTFPDLPTSNIGYPEGVAVGDVNGDTWPDVAVASYELGVLVWLNERTGFSPYGKGCGGNLPAAPVIGYSGQPKLGNAAFAWTVSQASANKPALLVMGISKRYLFVAPVLPLDLGPVGAPGCFLLAEARTQFNTATDSTGRASVPLPIPGAPALVGTVFYGQWGITDPVANKLGLAVSNGGAAKIGR